MEKEQKYKYMLFCNNCSNRIFTNGNITHLNKVNSAPVPMRADGKDKSVKSMIPKFKCDKCGYIFRVVELQQDAPKEEDFKEEKPIDFNTK